MSIFPTWFEISNFSCPDCHSPLAENNEAVLCIQCGAVYPIKDGVVYFVDLNNLNDFEVGESKFHTEIAKEADKAHGQQTLRVEYLHYGFLRPILQLPQDSLILDVGCGSGYDAIKLAKRGYYVVGI